MRRKGKIREYSTCLSNKTQSAPCLFMSLPDQEASNKRVSMPIYNRNSAPVVS